MHLIRSDSPQSIYQLVKLYYVNDLLDGDPAAVYDIELVIEKLPEGYSLDDHGVIAGFEHRQAILVCHSEDAHEQVKEFLEELRSHRSNITE